jgi:hypothetical protein
MEWLEQLIKKDRKLKVEDYQILVISIEMEIFYA